MPRREIVPHIRMHLGLIATPLPNAMFVFGNICLGIERKTGEVLIALAIFAVGQISVPQMSHLAGHTAPFSLNASMKALGPASEVIAHICLKLHRAGRLLPESVASQAVHSHSAADDPRVVEPAVRK